MRVRYSVRLGLVVGATLALLCAGQALATTLTFAGASIPAPPGQAAFAFDNGERAAQAVFSVSGNDLVITLTNTYTGDPRVPEEVLTAIFFDIAGSPDLDPVIAILGAGSQVHQMATVISVPGGDVSTEWAHLKDAPGLPATYAISSTGLEDLCGPWDRFDFTGNLCGPDSPGGLEYGITGPGDDWATGNGGMDVPLISDTVVFTLTGPPGVSVASVSNAYFHYGTDGPYLGPSPSPGIIPEPVTMLALLTGIAGLGDYLRRRTLIA